MRVYDLVKWQANAPFVYAKLSTSKVTGYEAYEDKDTVIPLSRIPDQRWQGWYWSDSQILVSNEDDDLYQDGRFLGADDKDVDATTKTYQKGVPGDPINNHTYQISDRTHRVALGASVISTYENIPARIGTVQVEKTLKLHVTILRNKALADGGTPVITTTDVNSDVAQMRESYAQIGIRIVLVENDNGKIVEIASVGDGQVRNPPEGVNLAPDFDEFSGVDVNGKIKMTTEEKSLLGYAAYRTPAEADDKNDIEVYYVNKLSRASAGEAFEAGGVPDIKYANSVILASFHAYTVLAHEATHVLLNSPGHEGGNVNPNAVQRTNLLVNGRSSLLTGLVTDSRRLTDAQGVTAFNAGANLLH